MKEFAITLGWLIVVAGCIMAAPVFGIIVGFGLAVWFLAAAFREHRDATKN